MTAGEMKVEVLKFCKEWKFKAEFNESVRTPAKNVLSSIFGVVVTIPSTRPIPAIDGEPFPEKPKLLHVQALGLYISEARYRCLEKAYNAIQSIREHGFAYIRPRSFVQLHAEAVMDALREGRFEQVRAHLKYHSRLWSELDAGEVMDLFVKACQLPEAVRLVRGERQLRTETRTKKEQLKAHKEADAEIGPLQSMLEVEFTRACNTYYPELLPVYLHVLHHVNVDLSVHFAKHGPKTLKMSKMARPSFADGCLKLETPASDIRWVSERSPRTIDSAINNMLPKYACVDIPTLVSPITGRINEPDEMPVPVFPPKPAPTDPLPTLRYGFDMETRATISFSRPLRAGILQIATDEDVFIFDLKRVTVRSKFMYQNIMRSPFILKLYVGASHLSELYSSFPDFECFKYAVCTLDVCRLFARLFPDHPQPVGLSKLTHFCLGKPIDNSMRMSDWNARPLSLAQFAYAALDAQCIPRVFDVLLQKLRHREAKLNPALSAEDVEARVLAMVWEDVEWEWEADPNVLERKRHGQSLIAQYVDKYIET